MGVYLMELLKVGQEEMRISALDRVRDFIREGKYLEGFSLVDSALKDDPSDVSFKFQKVRIYKLVGNYAMADKLLNEIKNVKGFDVVLLEFGHLSRKMSDDSLKADDKESAMNCLKDAIKCFSSPNIVEDRWIATACEETVDCYIKLGRIEKTRGNYVQANAYYSFAASKLKEYHTLPGGTQDHYLFLSGSLATSLGDKTKAYECFDKIVDRNANANLVKFSKTEIAILLVDQEYERSFYHPDEPDSIVQSIADGEKEYETRRNNVMMKRLVSRFPGNRTDVARVNAKFH